MGGLSFTFPNLIHDKTPQGISLIQWAAYCRNAVAIDLLKNLKQNWIFSKHVAGEQWIVENWLNKIRLWSINIQMMVLHHWDLLVFRKNCFGKILLVKMPIRLYPLMHLKVAPLHSACAISDFEICELLVRYGANVNASQEGGGPLCIRAAYYGNSKIVKLLLSENADKQAVTDQGKLPTKWPQRAILKSWICWVNKRMGRYFYSVFCLVIPDAILWYSLSFGSHNSIFIAFQVTDMQKPAIIKILK